jgi:tRNA G10  N-methylase Trm11
MVEISRKNIESLNKNIKKIEIFKQNAKYINEIEILKNNNIDAIVTE